MKVTDPSKALAMAIAYASKQHLGQEDKQGKPYILHCLTVMNKAMEKWPKDWELHCVAVLHDTIEDTGVTYEEIAETFGVAIASAVKAMSKRKGESYSLYLQRVRLNELATKAKICDLEHNSDFTRLKGITKKDHDRMIKYMDTYVFLTNELESRMIRQNMEEQTFGPKNREEQTFGPKNRE